MNGAGKVRLLGALAVVVALLAVGALWRAKRQDGQEPRTTVRADAAYVDPAVCAGCHAQIAASYAKTGMGRAFHTVRAVENELEGFQGKVFTHEASGSRFAIVKRDGTYIQRRWRLAFDGKETDVDEKRIDYVLGSGNHSRTYLHYTDDGFLQELPLGWYSAKGGYFAMNPGYDRPDYIGSVRPVAYECFFCHNGYPRGKVGDPAEIRYAKPMPEGIDCQRCHGPGGKHVMAAESGAEVAAIRAAIVNPKRLPADRGAEVCLQCHLETTNQKLPHAIRRFGREPFSYVPGEALADFQVAFDREPGKNQSFEVAQGGYRLRQSQCFLQSAGKLKCTSCHNPHDIPRGEPAQKQYNAVCQGCHGEARIRKIATRHTAADNCVNCHMPKRRTDDGIHIIMTDHWIARRPPPGDLLAMKRERSETADSSYRGEVVLHYPGQLPATPETELLVATAQVREQSNLTGGVPRLARALAQHQPTSPVYYAELAQAQLSAGDTTSAIKNFQEALKRDQNSALRYLQLGDARMAARDWTAAEPSLRKATELAPRDPRAWGRLGWALWQQNQGAGARQALEQAVALNGEVADVRNNLALVLLGRGDPEGAEREFRAALRIQPGVAEWRLNLARLLAGRGKTAEAKFQFEESLKFRPGYGDALLDYARFLTDLNQPAVAERQARLAVTALPSSADAHELLGALLAARRNMAAARPELEAAIRLQPDFGRAQFELGLLLAQLGDRLGARSHWMAAAQSPDPQARAAAAQALRQLEAN